ncbi:hypothetical protein U1Q18_001973 [Sarracenia purpurea var. burkii]
MTIGAISVGGISAFGSNPVANKFGRVIVVLLDWSLVVWSIISWNFAVVLILVNGSFAHVHRSIIRWRVVGLRLGRRHGRVFVSATQFLLHSFLLVILLL